MILLKDGWKYGNTFKDEEEFLIINRREAFSCPYSSLFISTNYCSGIGARVIPENVKIKLKIDFPSELIYSLWSVLQHGITKEPLPFHDAYVHIPIDFNNRTDQLILVYTLISVLLKEKNGNYTKGKIRFKEVDE